MTKHRPVTRGAKDRPTLSLWKKAMARPEPAKPAQPDLNKVAAWKRAIRQAHCE